MLTIRRAIESCGAMAALVTMLSSGTGGFARTALGQAPAPAPALDSTLLQELEAWWQFDWGDWFDNEVSSGPGLTFAPGATVFFESIPGGAERALDTAPAAFSAARLSQSNQVDHWTGPASGVLTTLIVVRVDGFPDSGEPQTLLSKWETGPRIQWRIDVDPVGEAAELVVETTAGTQSVSADGLQVGERVIVLTTIATPDTGLPSTVEVIGMDGVTRDSGAMTLTAPYQSDLPPHLEIARSGVDVGRSAEAAIDVVAVWSRTLTAAERTELASQADGLRFADIAGTVGLRPPGYRMERVADVLEGDIRHVVMGDSFCSTLGYNRVFPAILKVHDFSPLVGLASGARSSNALIRATSPVVDPSGENPRTIDHVDFYRCEWFNGTASNDFYGVPLNALSELRGHDQATAGPDGVLYTVTVNNSAMTDGATGRFSRAGDRIRTRLLHRRLSSDAIAMQSVRLADPGDPVGGGTIVDLLGGVPRQINASPNFVEQTVGDDLDTTVEVRETEPGAFSSAKGRLANLAGAVAWKVDPSGERRTGAYYTSLNDSSWTLQDFAQDLEANGKGNGKSYDLAQLRRWLAATTIDPDQPMVFWWYVDVEPIGVDLVAERAGAMIDLADEACSLEGLPRPRHILVIPHTHQRGSRTTDELAVVFEEFRAGYQQVAADPANDHVAVYSLRDATDGQYFDGRPESVQWLADRGYDEFEYGIYTGAAARDLVAQADLLDGLNVHPTNQTAAAFFASFLVDGILNPDTVPQCLGDLDGNGVVDFIDILEVLDVWGPCPGCPADFDGDGMVGFVDLLEVFSDWGPCGS